jgi:hypothetical protein
LYRTAAPTTPPGRATRRISAMASPASGTKCSISSDSTRSKLASGKVSAHSSPTSKLARVGGARTCMPDVHRREVDAGHMDRIGRGDEHPSGAARAAAQVEHPLPVGAAGKIDEDRGEAPAPATHLQLVAVAVGGAQGDHAVAMIVLPGAPAMLANDRSRIDVRRMHRSSCGAPCSAMRASAQRVQDCAQPRQSALQRNGASLVLPRTSGWAPIIACAHMDRPRTVKIAGQGALLHVPGAFVDQRAGCPQCLAPCREGERQPRPPAAIPRIR